MPQEQVPESSEGKLSILDVKCRDGTGNEFIVEMQKSIDNQFRERIQFYASRSFAAQIKVPTKRWYYQV